MSHRPRPPALVAGFAAPGLFRTDPVVASGGTTVYYSVAPHGAYPTASRRNLTTLECNSLPALLDAGPAATLDVGRFVPPFSAK